MTLAAAAAAAPMPARRGRSLVGMHLVAVPLLLAAAAWFVQRSGLDTAIARVAFDTGRDAYVGQGHAALEAIGHRWARAIPLVVALAAFALAAASHRLPNLRPWRDAALAAGISMLAVTLTIAALKHSVDVQCPYLVRIAGDPAVLARAEAVPFWYDPAGGDCLPSGHAGAGFTLLALYFAGWLRGSARWRWFGLAIGVGAGIAFGLVRISQGAHFASQTVWSAFVAWSVSALVAEAFRRRAVSAARRTPAPPSPR